VAAQNALLQRDRAPLISSIVHARGFQEPGLNIPDKLLARANEVIE
jgi:hypothetical protein